MAFPFKSFVLSTTMKRYEAVVEIIGTPNPSNVCLSVGLVGADNTYTFSNIQFEEGEVATPFDHRPMGLELALCQRYYEIGYYLRSGMMGDSSTSADSTNFATPKRTQPTVDGVVGALHNCTGATIHTVINPDGFSSYPSGIITANAITRYSLTWTADAEL